LTARNSGNSLVVPVVLVRRAKVELEMGRPLDAEADATKALVLEKPDLRPGQPSAVLGRTYLALARAQAANGKHDDAQRSFAAAALQLRPTLGAEHADTRLAERLGAADSAPGN
jgi:hypothetical protein